MVKGGSRLAGPPTISRRARVPAKFAITEFLDFIYAVLKKMTGRPWILTLDYESKSKVKIQDPSYL